MLTPVIKTSLITMVELGLTQADVLAFFAEEERKHDPDHFDEVIEEARRVYTTDELEIDDHPCLSPADTGCWVAAWVWVPEQDEEDEDDSRDGQR